MKRHLKLHQARMIKSQPKHENLHVLDGLRAEMIQVENKKTTYTIYMYTVFFAVFTAGFAYHELFLVALLILLIFQAQINYSTWLMRKVSVYIRCFFEEPRSDMHWESMQYDMEYLTAERNAKKTFAMRIATQGAMALAFITTLIELYLVITEAIEFGGLFHNGVHQFDMKCVGEIVLSCILCGAIAKITKEFEDAKGTELEAVIKKYYKKSYKK